MKKKKIRIAFDEERDFGTLCICALRYCHGRETYMPSLVRDIIRPHLYELCDTDIAVLLSDCDYQKRCNLYGDERIDKPGWIQWEQELIAEKARREENTID